MATAMRAQVSLMFDDQELFENFITPCKEERRLNGIIIKCLAAYYRDEKVRSLVDGASLEDMSDSEEVTSTQSICDNIRASLVMQDFLAEELKQTLDAGASEVEDILSQTNKQAEDRGFGSSYQTKSGSTILQLEAPKQQSQPEQTSAPAPVQATAPEGLAAVLCQAVMMLANTSGNQQVTALLQQAGLGGAPVAPPEPTETVRQTPVSEVPLRPASPPPEFVSEPPVVELEAGNDFAPEKESQPEDASDAMDDLLASL